MKNNYLIIFFYSSFVFLLISSCSIKGNFKGLYSYYNSTKSERPEMLISVDKSTSVCEIKQTNIPKIYIINGTQLKQCLLKEKALIYIWGPKCSSKICVPLEILQRDCNTKGIDLYIVAEYYDTEQMELKYDIKRPIFGIDIEYYKTSLTSKYLSKFIYDITATVDESNNRFFYFEDGVFIKTYNSIDEVL